MGDFHEFREVEQAGWSDRATSYLDYTGFVTAQAGLPQGIAAARSDGASGAIWRLFRNAITWF